MNEAGTSIVFDYRCTIVVTPHKDECVCPIKPSAQLMNGLLSTARVEGRYEVLWDLVDDYGATQHVRTKCFLVPYSKVWLFIPQACCQQYQAGSLS